MLEDRGWRVVDSHRVAATPWDYQHYIQESFGEFSCAKPACLKLENAWFSNRTLCYLASGKPAVVQHTGPSRFLPDSAGLFRFRDVKEAAQSIERVVTDYDKQSNLARNLAEEFFDARKVVATLLDRALS
jgi:glycosyltransferase involved in cell wall biosynthesis